MTNIIDFEHESATCQIVEWDDGTLSLSNVYSTVRRQGHATKLLTKVMLWVDEQGKLLKTAAEAHGPGDKMTTAQLVEYYKKFGFESLTNATNYVYMERKPK